MKKNEMRFAVLFAVAAIFVFAVAVVLKGRLVLAPEGSGMQVLAQASTSDSVALSPLADGDEVVADAPAGYYFSMPTNWYVEKNAGAELAVYPDYDPKEGGTPECKLELSAFDAVNPAAGGSNLNSWITSYLHADPTADVVEISRTPVQLSGASSSAIEWRGVLNGVTTTLVYAAMPGVAEGGKNILEIAPSTLSGSGDADNGDCDFALQALVANLKFGSYEP